MKATGFSPIIAYLIVILGFYAISFLLFSKTEFADYFYSLISLSFISKLSEKGRTDFLKTIFSNRNYRKLRILENLILTFPFLIFLVYQQSFLVALALICLSTLLSVFNFSNNFNYTIPTPFSKQPFEFVVGFRKTFFIIPFSYFLIYQSVLVDNFNLGISSMLLITLIVLSFYLKPENEFFVWNFSTTSKHFLRSKIKIALLYFTLLSLPIIISLLLFFPKEIIIVLAFLLLSYIYIITIIFVKYSAYPNEISLTEGILISTSLMFPPLLLIITPLLYNKSIKQLNNILEND
jgi:hypothetical protein